MADIYPILRRRWNITTKCSKSNLITLGHVTNGVATFVMQLMIESAYCSVEVRPDFTAMNRLLFRVLAV